ncbi:MAG: type II toxin-antitoxin system HicA family toxin [Collimonas sp.]|uniref:type II toxin-antitoxin system HicA family toxin n=1 Tax=Collimonas sp. TaxID=1963772 RepID=UPI0032677CB0
MTRSDKLRSRAESVPADFTWHELVVLLDIYGFSEFSDKGGSYRSFKTEAGLKIFVHKPHPGNIVKKYLLRKVIGKLKEFGLMSANEE